MKKQKNKNFSRKQPIKQSIGLDYKSLLRLFLNKYNDYKNVYEAEHNEPCVTFDLWLDNLRAENVFKGSTEKNILKKKISKCIDEAISLVFKTYSETHPDADVLFYDYVKGVVSE